ncbi:hypothetical protein SDC9_171320 [bioreactor metagenome]|uniref:Uncharacterized protein n=1 Tax=bioreactor metagenome TaxID=1076179 RepID=A0A645GAI3_9ZZZZ
MVLVLAFHGHDQLKLLREVPVLHLRRKLVDSLESLFRMGKHCGQCFNKPDRSEFDGEVCERRNLLESRDDVESKPSDNQVAPDMVHHEVNGIVHMMPLGEPVHEVLEFFSVFVPFRHLDSTEQITTRFANHELSVVHPLGRRYVMLLLVDHLEPNAGGVQIERINTSGAFEGHGPVGTFLCRFGLNGKEIIYLSLLCTTDKREVVGDKSQPLVLYLIIYI